MSAFKPLNFWSQNKKCLEHYTVFRVFFWLLGGGGLLRRYVLCENGDWKVKNKIHSTSSCALYKEWCCIKAT